MDVRESGDHCLETTIDQRTPLERHEGGGRGAGGTVTITDPMPLVINNRTGDLLQLSGTRRLFFSWFLRS